MRLAARRVVHRHHQAAAAQHQRQRRQPAGHRVAAARAALRPRPGTASRRPAGSPSCAPAPVCRSSRETMPLRTSSSPSGTLRSWRCCASASSSCASVMKPSAISASPMRTIGMRDWRSIACFQLLGGHDLAPPACRRASACAARPARDAVASMCSRVAACCCTSSSPMRSPSSTPLVGGQRHEVPAQPAQAVDRLEQEHAVIGLLGAG